MAILREYHKPQTLEETSHNLDGAKYFSKIDAKNGFWFIHLDELSKILINFNAHLGYFKFNWMCFGLCMS